MTASGPLTELMRRNGIDPPTELVPLRPGDERVVIVRDLMISGEWERRRGELIPELMQRWGISRNAVEQYATEAGRFLRIQRVPELLAETAVAELRVIAEQQAQVAPAVAVAAWKTILDALGKLVERVRTPAGPQVDRGATLVQLLRSPPPELVRLLEEHWGPRTVYRADEEQR